MLELTKFGKNPFISHAFGIDDLVAFTTDNLSKMIKKNPNGIFTDCIAATNGALAKVDKAFSEETTDNAIRKAQKHAKDTFRAGLAETIGQIFAMVEAKYGVSSLQVRQCFGEGRTVFHTVRDDLLQDKFTSLIDALTAYQPDLAPALALANNLQTTWEALHDQSEDSSGGASMAAVDRRTARKALAVELFKNLLTIALSFPEDHEQIAIYMQQSLLVRPNHQPEPPQPAPPAPAPNP